MKSKNKICLDFLHDIMSKNINSNLIKNENNQQDMTEKKLKISKNINVCPKIEKIENNSDLTKDVKISQNLSQNNNFEQNKQKDSKSEFVSCRQSSFKNTTSQLNNVNLRKNSAKEKRGASLSLQSSTIDKSLESIQSQNQVDKKPTELKRNKKNLDHIDTELEYGHKRDQELFIDRIILKKLISIYKIGDKNAKIINLAGLRSLSCEIISEIEIILKGVQKIET